MITGYTIQSVLALFFEAVAIIAPRLPAVGLWNQRLAEWQTVIDIYLDTSIYFTLAIQLATGAVLARRDFGISSDPLGAYDVQAAWTVSILTILPLLIAFHSG